MKKLLIIFTSCLLLFTGCTGKSASGDNAAPVEEADKKEETQVVLTTGFSRDEVFRIGRSSCSLKEYMLYLTNIQNRYESVYGNQIWTVSNNGMTMENCVKNAALARIAQVKTMNLLAGDYQVVLTEQEQNKVKQAADEYYASLNDKEKALLELSEENVISLYQEYLVAHKVYAYIIRDINPEISDDEARSVTVDWIYLKKAEDNATVLSLINEIKTRLDAGEDFNSLASAYSDDKTVTHSFGKGNVETAVEECAFNLSQGEISPVVEGENGYYIIRCVSTLDRKETDANKEKIITQRKKEAFNEVYGTFTNEQVRQLNNKLWNSITLLHDEELTTNSFFDIYSDYFPEEE